MLEKTNVYIAKPFEKEIEKIKINDSVNFYLLPYLHISQIKRIFPDKNINTLNEAFKVLIDNTSINEKETNIILAHQFVVGGDLILSDSEQKSVGGVDEIHYSVFEKFDYCALGHLHCPQKVGMDKIRYGGSILKYSLSEINQKKSFCIIEIDDDKKIKFKFEPISFIHEMKQYRGKIDEFLSENFYSNIDTEDYIHFILEDEEVIDAKKKLSLIYPNIMLIQFDNSFTRSLNAEFKAVISQDKTIVEHFMDFYKIQTETELNKSDIELIKEISVELGGQECAQ